MSKFLQYLMCDIMQTIIMSHVFNICFIIKHLQQNACQTQWDKQSYIPCFVSILSLNIETRLLLAFIL